MKFMKISKSDEIFTCHLQMTLAWNNFSLVENTDWMIFPIVWTESHIMESQQGLHTHVDVQPKLVPQKSLNMGLIFIKKTFERVQFYKKNWKIFRSLLFFYRWKPLEMGPNLKRKSSKIKCFRVLDIDWGFRWWMHTPSKK